MADFINNSTVRLVGMILLLGIPSVLITLLIAKHEGRRRSLKYMLPIILILLSAACFINGIFFDNTMGGLGYIVLGIILVVPGMAGFLTAIIAGARHNKRKYNKHSPINLYKYK